MIKLNININPDDILRDKAKYDREVSASLQKLAGLVPEHKSEDFIERLWGYFKLELWTQQGYKCAYCERSIVADDTHLEHFRPKAEARDEKNIVKTREAYWWLAYDHRNYIASCLTCNNRKGNRFPIENEGTRVTAQDMDNLIDLNDEGVLGNEKPYIINPRHRNPEPHLEYRHAPDVIMPMLYIAGKDETGKKTIRVLDLNRTGRNKKDFKDNLPGKRANILSLFKKDVRKYEDLKNKLHSFRLIQVERSEANLQTAIDGLELNIGKKKQAITKQFLSHVAEFSGMCLFWLKNATDLADDFRNPAT